MIQKMKMESHKRKSHLEHVSAIKKMEAFVLRHVNVFASMEAALSFVPAKRTVPVSAIGTKLLSPPE